MSTHSPAPGIQDNLPRDSGGSRGAPQFLVIAGEPSADLHGAGLIRELKRRIPGCTVFGIGGRLMREEGTEIIFPVEKTAFLGFIEVLRHLPFIRKMFNVLLAEAEKRNPAAVILIDYPGFNIRFAKEIRKRHGHAIRIFYYISPQVWAWKKERIHTLAQSIDAIAVVFPFEEELYRQAGVSVRFVGHPLLESVAPESPQERFLSACGAAPGTKIIGLLPGSRVQEIRRHLPVMIQALERVNDRFPGFTAVIGRVPHIPAAFYERFTGGAHFRNMLSEEIYAIMHYSTFLIIASGTATLEAALAGTPMVIIYRMSPVTYAIARRLVTVPRIGLVNIVHGERVVPELIQKDASPENVAHITETLLSDGGIYAKTQKKLRTTRTLLGKPGAACRAVDFLLEIL